MVSKHLILAIILSALLCFPVYGAQQMRPKAGIGLLLMQPFASDRASVTDCMTLYNYPGVKRIAEVNSDVVSAHGRVLRTDSGTCAIGVTGKKGNWVKVAYDDAGREGWVKMERSWSYTPWQSFLKGRSSALLPKLRKQFYLLRKSQSESSEPIDTLSSQQKLQIVTIDGDWARIMAEGIPAGWIRWRDPEGRLMISLEP
jgi:SH3-like domain-containing protein